MERYDVRNGEYGFVSVRPDKHGAFCYALHALRYKKRFHLSAACNVLLVVACAVLAGYLSYHKHDPVPVQVSEEEYRAAQQQAQQAQTERAALLRRIEDLGAIRRNLAAQLRTQNANNAKLVQQLKDVQASVPPLPVIQKALYDEAKTDAGFRAAVTRNFGSEIAGRIEVRP